MVIEFKKNNIKKRRYFGISVIGFIALIAITFCIQFLICIQNQKENSYAKLTIAKNRIISNVLEEEQDFESYDLYMQSKADLIALQLDEMGDISDSAMMLRELNEAWKLDGISIFNGKAAKCSTGFSIADHTVEKFMSGSSFDTDKDAGMCFYHSMLSNGDMLIIAQESRSLLTKEDYMVNVANALSTIKVGKTGYIVAYDTEKNNGESIIAYAPKESVFVNDNVVKTICAIKSGTSGCYRVEGGLYYLTVLDYENYKLAAVVPKAEMYSYVGRSVAVAAVIFGLMLAIVTVYGIFLCEDIKSGLVVKEKIKEKLKLASAVGILFVIIFSLYTFLLVSISENENRLSDKLDSVENIIQQNDRKTEDIVKTYEKQYIDLANSLAYLFDCNEEFIDNDKLEEISRKACVESIYIFNKEGTVDASNTVFTDFKLSLDPSSQSYEFWNVVKGYDDYIVQEPMEDDTVKHNLVQYVGVKRRDKDGMVEIGISPKRLQDRLFGDSLKEILENIAVEDGGEIVSSEVPGNGEIEEFGFNRDNGALNLSMSRIIDDMVITVSKPVSRMIREGLILSIVIALVSAYLIFLIGKMIICECNNLPEQSCDNENNDSVKGTTLHVNTPWRKLTATGKITRIISIISAIFILIVICVINLTNYEKSNVLCFILSRNWNRGINIFSLTYVLFVGVEIVFFTTILRELILIFSVGNGSRVETFGRLFNSIIKYLAGIGTVFYCLYFLGVDSKTLLASAGILSLGISLGAQSLVSDILAGLFIVFEGDFRVGDIVTIDGFRGMVKDIGIRTTKIESVGKDIKIFKNSSISGVVNMTKKHSFAVVDCGIEYEESIERVEAVLKKELPKIKGRISGVVEGPFYKGVTELGDSSVVIRVVAQCHEKDRIQTERDLNRELKLIFDKHHVGIPFPQLVVHQPESKVSATAKERREAEAFVNEQKKLSEEYVADSDE